MIDKIVTVLAGLSFVYADVIATHYSMPTVGVYSSINNGPGFRRAYPLNPAPIYEENMEDFPFQSPHEAQHGQLFHVMNTPYPSPRKFDNIANVNTRTPYLSQAIQNRVLFQPAYSSLPDNNRSTAPVTFTTQTHSSPLVNSYSGSILATTYGHPAFPSHAPVASQATITYSEAPVVSHTTFPGHGIRYNGK